MTLPSPTYSKWTSSTEFCNFHLTSSDGSNGSYFLTAPKYVVSTTLETLEWNNSRLIKENILEEIKKLKHEISRGILIDGGSDLVNLLLRHDLIDEYRLLVHPLVVGKGKRLFQDGSEKKDLRLREARVFSTGVVALTYQPAEARNE